VSHIVTIETKVRDPRAVAAACRRLRLTPPVEGTAKLYAGDVSGVIVQLPDWQYPIVIDVRSGAIHYDDFAGQWGDKQHLDRFVQIYSVEKVKLEAHKKGSSVTEQTLQDGSIKLQIIEAAA
jgi:hypothetical protein